MTAYAPAVYTGDGAQTDFAVPFGYLVGTDLVVAVDGAPVSYTFLSAGMVQVTPAPAIGLIVKLYRETANAARNVIFANAASLTGPQLNKSANQLFFMAQEAVAIANEAMVLNAADVFDAGGKRVTNVGDPVNAQDAATKNWVNLSSSSLVAQAAGSAAAAAANAGLTAADRAVTTSDRGVVAADKAVVAADKAIVLAQKALVDIAKAAVDSQKALVDTAKGLVDTAKAAADADVVLTHADVVLTGLDKVATATDRVQTDLDKVATAADRVQTGLDRASATASAATAASGVLGAILGWANKVAPANGDVFGYAQASDSSGRKFTWGDIRTALAGLFARFDAAQTLTQTQKGQVSANIGLAWEQIGAKVDVSTAVASVTWTGLSAYRQLRLSGYATPATDGQSLGLRLSSNDGVSYIATATYDAQLISAAAAAVSTAADPSNTGFFMTGSTGNVANEGTHVDVAIEQFNKAFKTEMRSHCYSTATDSMLTIRIGSGREANVAAMNAIQLLFSTGNIAVGSYFTLEGVRG